MIFCLFLLLATALYVFLSVRRIIRFRKVTEKPTHTFKFNGKTYPVCAKRYNLIQSALQGNEKAQYKIITEYNDPDHLAQFIPDLCFFFTQQLAQKEKDLGVLTQLGDLYFNGVGTETDTKKAADMYRKALQLFDNPTPGLYIPQKSEAYKKFLQKTLQEYEGAK